MTESEWIDLSSVRNPPHSQRYRERLRELREYMDYMGLPKKKKSEAHDWMKEGF